jgi:hypothetical protein
MTFAHILRVECGTATCRNIIGIGRDLKNFPVEVGTIERAMSTLNRIAGTSKDDSQKIVSSAIEAAIEQVIESLVGIGLLPTTISELRVDLLNRVSMKMNRQLTVLEIQTLFRTTPNIAKSTQVKVQSIFAQPLFDQFLADMRNDAVYVETRPKDKKSSWKVSFHKDSTFRTAVDEIVRSNLDRDVTLNEVERFIELEKEFMLNGQKIDLREILGLAIRARR